MVSESWRDPVVECLALYATEGSLVLSRETAQDAKLILIDTMAVGLGAFDHPAAVVARRYLSLFPFDPNGSVVWGTPFRASPDKATLVNGVTLRCYDYNDVLIGRRGGGHPSDMISALIAIADARNLSGAALLSALAIGYDVVEALYDVVPTETAGWDHATVSALGATCAIGRLIGLTFDQQCEALAIAALQHLQSDEIESSILNRRGDLTMWKRFHGGDAMRHALDSCLLASIGAEGAVRPFSGRLGFLAKFGVTEDVLPTLATRLVPGQLTAAMAHTNLKRWPVGSRAQSAIASAIDAVRKLPEGSEVEAVRVETQQGVYDHLVGIRQDPWRPHSRETADHSLPYIVGAAVLDGEIGTASFNLEKVYDRKRADFIANKVHVSISPWLKGTQNLSEVSLVTKTGETVTGIVKPGPGHRDNRFSPDDVAEKFMENAKSLLGEARAEQVHRVLRDIESAASVRSLTSLLLTETVPA